jgi:hypothetical protein
MSVALKRRLAKLERFPFALAHGSRSSVLFGQANDESCARMCSPRCGWHLRRHNPLDLTVLFDMGSGETLRGPCRAGKSETYAHALGADVGYPSAEAYRYPHLRCAPMEIPKAMSWRRVMPRQTTMLPGGGSCLRAR